MERSLVITISRNFLNRMVSFIKIPLLIVLNKMEELRLHGTLIANANAIVAEAKLHHKFWQDAIATANYIHYRLPHKGNDNKVPFKLLYNEKVDYGKLKVFGCQVYFYIPK